MMYRQIRLAWVTEILLLTTPQEPTLPALLIFATLQTASRIWSLRKELFREPSLRHSMLWFRLPQDWKGRTRTEVSRIGFGRNPVRSLLFSEDPIMVLPTIP